MKNIFLPVLLIIIGCNQKPDSGNNSQPTKETIIAFGSCSDQNLNTQLWSEIAAKDPDLFILLGDIVYADTHDMDTMKAAYQKQKSDSAYQKLLSKTKIIGTWDDHDYGINDGGKHYTKKDSSKQLLLDFLDVPENAEVRDHKGVYSSYLLEDHDRSVKVILLDTRYSRDTLMPDTTSNQRYIPNKEGKILNETQWQWLKNELENSSADVNIIGSSIQVIPTQHPFEMWANFPQERQRLLDLIAATQPENTLIISGDRHIAELSKMEVEGLDYPLYDFTSSGLTHTWSEIWEEQNRYRKGNIIIARNYGLIKINWPEQKMTLQVLGEQNKILLEHDIKIN